MYSSCNLCQYIFDCYVSFTGLDGLWWYVTLSVALVLVLLLFGYFKKT